MKPFDLSKAELVEGHAPAVLFKYRSCCEFTKQLLRGIAYFATAKELNDPFEYHILREPVSDLQEAVKVAQEMQKWSAPDLHPESDDWQSWMNETIQFLLRERGFRGTSQIPQKMDPGFGVFCLSESPKDIRMWSHYADAHKGICLGLSTAIIKTKSRFAKVQYVDEMPTITTVDLFTSSLGAVAPFIFKASSWRDEAEWRVFNPAGPVEFPKTIVAEIVFGARIDAEEKRELLSIVKSYEHPVKLFQAVLNNSRYEIELEADTEHS